MAQSLQSLAILRTGRPRWGAKVAFLGLALLAVVGPSETARADELVSWGWDFYNQVSNTPMGTHYVAIEAGVQHSIALDTSGKIYAWGLDADGQVSNTPSASGFTAIATGFRHNLALDATGKIHAWGWNDDGQVSNTPLGSGFIALGAGRENSLALDATGHIHVWGDDTKNQISNAPTGGGFVAINSSHAGFFAIALDGTGTIHAWGSDAYGQVSGTPLGPGFTAIASGVQHNLALDATGKIHAWGADYHGQVSNTPPGTGFTAIDAGSDHSLALDAFGQIYAWGDDSNGQVSLSPAGTGYTDIDGGNRHTVALYDPPPSYPGCPPSINCPAPNSNDPTSTARLVLFPGTSSSVRDNDLSEDLDPQCGVLTVADVPFPDDPFATFSGTLLLNAPTLSTPGKLVATLATIQNTTGLEDGTQGMVLSRGEISFACAEFYATTPEFPVSSGPPKAVSGSLTVGIDGSLAAKPPLSVTAGSEELEITAVGTTFAVPSQPASPPGEVMASWISAGAAPSPETMFAQASKTGSYLLGPGIIGLKMNVHLPEGESMQLPTSIEVKASTGSASLVNRNFDLDPTDPQNGWTFEGTGTLTHNVSQGSPEAPSVRIDADGPFYGVLSQCIGVVGAELYEFSARSYTHNSNGDSSNSISVSFFSSADCSTGLIETVGTDTISFPDWALRKRSDYPAPDAAKSALLQLVVDGGSRGNLSRVSFDTVFLPEPGSLASGVAAWLALVALRNRRRGRCNAGLGN